MHSLKMTRLVRRNSRVLQKTPEAVKDGGVIATPPNQEVHCQAFANAHQNDKTLSEPDMIAINDGESVEQYKARVAQIQANRFGFFDSEKEDEHVFDKPAKEGVDPMPALSPTLREGPYNSEGIACAKGEEEFVKATFCDPFVPELYRSILKFHKARSLEHMQDPSLEEPRQK
jgi:hypothetical protein